MNSSTATQNSISKEVIIENITDKTRKKQLKIWLCDLTYTQQSISADHIPQAVGGIATFTEKQVNLAHPIRIFKYPKKLAEKLSKDGIPDVIGFSNYVWNSNLSYAFVKRIKERAPKTVVIFGGPNFPTVEEEAESYLRKRPLIDFYIVKEGELAFSRVVNELISPGISLDDIHGKIPSVHSIDNEGTYHRPQTIERLRDLSTIPSPYITGRMDEFFDGKLTPIIQTNRGCPFSCTFCVEGVQYYNKVYKNSKEKIASEIDYIANMMKKTRSTGEDRKDLYIADSNFGMYKDDIFTCEQIANAQKKFSWPIYINVATGKNQKKRILEAARLINGAMRLSGSVQSLDAEVLSNIKRSNIAPEQLMTLALEASKIGTNSYCELILGLPGESKKSHYKTLNQTITAGFGVIYTFQLMMLPGSEMCTKESRKKFEMDTRFRIYPRCFGHFNILDKPVTVAEIEEVCVGSSSLSFEDYLDCRKMHLMIAIFHNDGIFSTILNFIRTQKLSVYRWLELLNENSSSKKFESLKNDFISMTKEELWNNENDLKKFIQKDNTIEKLLGGDIGINLLFTFKSRAMINCTEELSKLVKESTLQLLNETGFDSSINKTFVNEAAEYHRCKMTNLFSNIEEEPETDLLFDFKRYEADNEPKPIEEYKYSSAKKKNFFLTKEQKDLVKRYLRVYGNTKHDIGRMFTKAFLDKLLRSVKN